MTELKQDRPKRKQPKLTLLQIMGLVILGGCILVVGHQHAWF